MPIKINDIIDIAHEYDTLLIDMCGVLHDGKQEITGASQKLTQLLIRGLKVCLFSNSPRIVTESKKQLEKYGVHHTGCFISTSGQFFLDQVKKINDGVFYVLGVGKNPNLVEEMVRSNIKFTTDIANATHMIILEHATDEKAIYKHDETLHMAVGLKIKALCPNPDQIAVSDKDIVYPQGAFASRYESFGGAVEYFGKPYSGFYKYTVKLISDYYNYQPSSILAIGDNLHTDIAGANRFGVDSVLVSSGVYSLDNQQYKDFIPKYVIQAFGA